MFFMQVLKMTFNIHMTSIRYISLSSHQSACKENWIMASVGGRLTLTFAEKIRILKFLLFKRFPKDRDHVVLKILSVQKFQYQ